MSKYSRKRRLWPLATTATVLATAAAVSVTLAGGFGSSALTSDTSPAGLFAARSAATPTTLYGCQRHPGPHGVFDISTVKHACPAGTVEVSWPVHGRHHRHRPHPNPSASATTPTPTPTPTTATPTPSETTVTPTPSESTATPTPSETTATPTPSETTATPTPSETTATPTPSETTVTPTPSESTATPTPSSTGTGTWAWCSSDPFGQWTVSDGRFDLYNNEWNTADNPGPQTICGNSESDWQAVSTQPAGNTAVLTAPSVQIPYNNSNGYPLSQFSHLTSSYTETMNAVAGTDAEAMYDIWLNGLNKEVMFWVDNHGQTPAGSKVATTTFGGSTWDLWQTGDGYWAFVRQGNASSGSVDLLAGLQYLESQGDLTGTDTLWQVNFGWEICSTAGAPETFTVSNFSVNSSPNS